MMNIVKSINDVPIRLTEERWYEHIVYKRPFINGYKQAVLDAVENPQFILRGNNKSKVAVVNLGRRKWLHVVYRELSKTDGFIITAKFERETEARTSVRAEKFSRPY